MTEQHTEMKYFENIKTQLVEERFTRQLRYFDPSLLLAHPYKSFLTFSGSRLLNSISHEH